MRTAMKLIFATLVLTLSATAADRTKGAFLQNATSGYYEFQGSNIIMYVGADAYNIPGGSTAGYLNVTVYDWAGYRQLSASGPVPRSVFKINGNTLSINIADLRDLVGSGLYLWEQGFPGPIPLNCTMRATSLWKEDMTGKTTERYPQPDGTVVMQKYASKYTRSSMSIEGNVAGYALPLSDPWYAYYYGYLYQGDYKSHLVW